MRQPGPRTYYVLLAGQAVSFLGSQISGLAVGIAVFRQTGHATPLALVSVFWTAPQVVLAGFGGLFADRFDRRRLMLAANFGYALSSALLLLSFASGAFQLWHLYALMLANGVFAALEGPAFQSSITMLVPDAQRDRANALAQFAFPTAIALAAAAAGVLYAAIGVTGAIEVDLTTFAAVIAVLALIRIPMPAKTAEGAHRGGLLRQSLFGFGYLRARPGLLGLCLYIAVVEAVASGAFVLMTPYVLDRVHATATFGIVVGIGNSGAIAGALVMGAWGGTRPRMHTLMPSAVAIGLFMALAGLTRSAAPIAAAFFLMSFALPFANTTLNSIFQAKIAPDVQGRVLAAIGQIGGVLAPAATLAAGPLADRVFERAVGRPGWDAVAWLVGAHAGSGMGLMFALAGALTAIATLVAYAHPAIRKLERDLPDHAPEALATTGA